MGNISIKKSGRQKTLTIEQYNKVLELAEKRDLRDYCLLYMTGELGLRVGEVVKLRWENIHRKALTIDIPIVKFQNLKKDEIQREYITMPIDNEMISTLQSYCDTYFLKPEGWLFPGSGYWRKSHLTRSMAQEIFYRYAKSLKIHASIHSLRHYRGYRIYDKFGSIEAVRDVLRHKHVSSAEVYSHADIDRKRRLMYGDKT